MFVLPYASAKENASWRPKVDFDTGQGWKTVSKEAASRTFTLVFSSPSFAIS